MAISQNFKRTTHIFTGLLNNSKAYDIINLTKRQKSLTQLIRQFGTVLYYIIFWKHCQAFLQFFQNLDILAIHSGWLFICPDPWAFFALHDSCEFGSGPNLPAAGAQTMRPFCRCAAARHTPVAEFTPRGKNDGARPPEDVAKTEARLFYIAKAANNLTFKSHKKQAPERCLFLNQSGFSGATLYFPAPARRNTSLIISTHPAAPEKKI